MYDDACHLRRGRVYSGLFLSILAILLSAPAAVALGPPDAILQGVAAPWTSNTTVA